MGMFYEQEITVVLPLNRPASYKVLLRTVTPVPCTQSSRLSEDCCRMRARLDATFGHVTELQIWLWPCDTVPWNGLHWDIWMMVGTVYVRLRQRLCERQIAMLLWLTAVRLYQVAGFHSPGFYYATYKSVLDAMMGTGLHILPDP